MKKEVYVLTVVLLGSLALTTGCASKKRHQRDVTHLQTQIGTLQSEIARLDQAVKDAQISSGAQTGSGASTLGQFTEGNIYRTPAGFELPAASVQRALKNAGFYQGEIDGKIGSGTKQAIRDFQRDQGLKADGVCGKQTWSKLKSFA